MIKDKKQINLKRLQMNIKLNQLKISKIYKFKKNLILNIK